jgi:hypothetical protein
MIGSLDSSDTGKKLGVHWIVHQLFVDFKKVYDSVMREVLYNIFTDFGVPTKVVRMIKTCSNETYSKVCIRKLLSDNFPNQNGLKKGKALLHLLYNFAVGYRMSLGRSRRTR